MPTPINWVTSVNEVGNSTNNATFVETSVVFFPDATVGDPPPDAPIVIDFTTGLTSISGTIDLNIFDVVSGTASFDMTRRFVDVSFDGSTIAYDEASLLEEVGPAVACARWDAGSSGWGDDGGWAEEGNDDW